MWRCVAASATAADVVVGIIFWLARVFVVALIFAVGSILIFYSFFLGYGTVQTDARLKCPYASFADPVGLFFLVSFP